MSDLNSNDDDAFQDANEESLDNKQPVQQTETANSSSKKAKKNKKKKKAAKAQDSSEDLTEETNKDATAEDSAYTQPEETGESTDTNDNEETEKTGTTEVDHVQDGGIETNEAPEENLKEQESNADISNQAGGKVLVDEESQEQAAKADDQPELVQNPTNVSIEEANKIGETANAHNSTEPPLSESTSLVDQETPEELQEENQRLEAQLEELKHLNEEEKDFSDSSDRILPPVPENKGVFPPEVPPGDEVGAPALPDRSHHGGVVEKKDKFPFPIPELPQRDSKPLAPPLPQRDAETGKPLSTTSTPLVKNVSEFAPPPLPPQLSEAQKNQHRKGGAVFSSWFGRPSTDRSESTPVSEKSIEYEENYDLLLSRLNDNNEEFESRDEVFREQINTSEDLLRTSFKEKVSFWEDSSLEESTQESEIAKIDWRFWTQVVNDYSSVAKSNPSKLSQEISNGIPSQVRGIVWQLVSKSNSKEYDQKFSELLSQESSFEKNIKKDLSRTNYLADNGIDSESLYRVLKVYSLLDPEVGYTQGMAFITVPLLINLSELESLSLLHKLMHSYHVRSLYLPEMPGLLLKLYQFDRLLEDTLPNLHNHFQREGVRSSMYASQWFLTFFAYKFPLEFVLRIFDIVITEGFESLLKFALALVQKNEEKLLSLRFDDLIEFLKIGLFSAYQIIPEDSASNEELSTATRNEGFAIDFLKTSHSTPPVITVDSYDVNKLVEDATSIKIAPITLRRLEEEYNEIHREEKERRQEIEEVRLRNNQLNREIKTIEKSYTILNREHVQIANEMIQGRMRIVTLEDENKELKEHNQALRERVKALQAPAEVVVPSSLEDDLKITMERNLEVMTKNEELENQLSDLLLEIEQLKAEKNQTAEVDNNPSSSPAKLHRHSHSSSNWTKGFFKR